MAKAKPWTVNPPRGFVLRCTTPLSEGDRQLQFKSVTLDRSLIPKAAILAALENAGADSEQAGNIRKVL